MCRLSTRNIGSDSDAASRFTIWFRYGYSSIGINHRNTLTYSETSSLSVEPIIPMHLEQPLSPETEKRYES